MKKKKDIANEENLKVVSGVRSVLNTNQAVIALNYFM